MFRLPGDRTRHYLLLLVAWVVLCLVNLGAPSLWDIDEGNNAQCASEMYEAGNWVVPTFNFELRVDKPALLYWFQMLGYSLFGVNEFAARFPSALASLCSMLLVYELGRRMFGAGAGFLAGLILASTVLFTGAAHFANPDALLTACSLLSFWFFWRDFESGRDRWLIWMGLSTGLAMLAKGPVGLVLPGTVLVLFLAWMGQLGRLRRFALLRGLGLFLLIATPWYAWVIADTRGAFFRGFFLQHNVNRFLAPMENHRGPVVYYLLVLLVGFAPWSNFFSLTAWHAWKHTRALPQADPRYRFLLCWIAVYLLFFSVSRTKLPNYVLPLYPALALLTAHGLDRWRRGEITPPAWLVHLTLSSLVLTGVLTTVGLLLGGGVIGGSLLRGRHLPGVERWAFLGALPILAAVLAWWHLRWQQRESALRVIGVLSVAWVGLLLGFASGAVDRFKAPRPLAELLRADQPEGEVVVTAFRYFQPSLVFYCGRRIDRVEHPDQLRDRLNYPVPSYVFLPADAWEQVRTWPRLTCRELGRHRDLYRGIDIVLITNHDPHADN